MRERERDEDIEKDTRSVSLSSGFCRDLDEISWGPQQYDYDDDDDSHKSDVANTRAESSRT